MAGSYATGKYARAICDRCGTEVAYKKLKKEWTGYLVCEPCWDPKTALEFPTNFAVDAEAIRNPRPDNDVEASQGVAIINDIRPMQNASVSGGTFSGILLDIEIGEITGTIT